MRFALLITVLLAGCSSEPSVTLSSDPDTVVFDGFGAQPLPGAVQLLSAPAPVSWTTSVNASWLNPVPQAGTSTPATINLLADATGLGGGTHHATLRLTSEGGEVAVPIRLRVPKMDGTWRAAFPDTITLEVTLSDTNGVLAGAGKFIGANGYLAVGAAGSHIHPNIIVSVDAAFFFPVTFSGAFVSPDVLAGAITGSGYNGVPVTFIRIENP